LTDQITLEEALELVDFEPCPEGWRVKNVNGSVYGDVLCNVWGDVGGTINGRRWKFIEPLKEELKRLIQEGADKDEILEALNQLEDSDD